MVSTVRRFHRARRRLGAIDRARVVVDRPVDRDRVRRRGVRAFVASRARRGSRVVARRASRAGSRVARRARAARATTPRAPAAGMRREAISGAATARDKNCNRSSLMGDRRRTERSRRLFRALEFFRRLDVTGARRSRDATELNDQLTTDD